METVMEHVLNPVGDDGKLGTAASGESLPVAQPLALTELHAAGGSGSRAPLHTETLPTSPLARVKAQLTVCVGTTMLTVGELMAVQEQQVLRLDSKVAQPVDLLLEGKVVARGQLVAVDEHFGVRITELPVALKV